MGVSGGEPLSEELEAKAMTQQPCLGCGQNVWWDAERPVVCNDCDNSLAAQYGIIAKQSAALLASQEQAKALGEECYQRGLTISRLECERDDLLAAAYQAKALAEALEECCVQSPHSVGAPEGCLCRWCKARRLLPESTKERLLKLGQRIVERTTIAVLGDTCPRCESSPCECAPLTGILDK